MRINLFVQIQYFNLFLKRTLKVIFTLSTRSYFMRVRCGLSVHSSTCFRTMTIDPNLQRRYDRTRNASNVFVLKLQQFGFTKVKESAIEIHVIPWVPKYQIETMHTITFLSCLREEFLSIKNNKTQVTTDGKMTKISSNTDGFSRSLIICLSSG